jgi:hypothetical protein
VAAPARWRSGWSPGDLALAGPEPPVSAPPLASTSSDDTMGGLGIRQLTATISKHWRAVDNERLRLDDT